MRKQSSLMTAMKTPYLLDSYVNKHETKPNKNKESLAENVRLMLASEAIFEDESLGMAAVGFTSEEVAEMDQETLHQIMLGVDLEEAEEEEAERHNVSDLEKEALYEYRELIKEENKGVLDMSYFHLGNDGLKAIIPVLEKEHFLAVKKLDISFNSLNDVGVEPVIQSLAALGSGIEELNMSGNNLSDGICKLLSDHIRAGKCKYLANVIVEDCPKISDDGRRVLKIAQMKAQGNKGNATLNSMMGAAKGRDSAHFGIKFEE